MDGQAVKQVIRAELLNAVQFAIESFGEFAGGLLVVPESD
jgi:hypothetical protein